MLGETKKILKKLVCTGIVILALAGIEKARAAIWYVNPGESIQAAIDNAVAGDEVHVNAGTYYEKITMKDGVDLIGASADVTTIDAGGSTNCRIVNAEYIQDPTTTLAGFTITNGGRNCHGVLMDHSYMIVERNIIRDNGALGTNPTYSGRGISVFNSVPMIRQNVITDNVESGIYIQSSYQSDLEPALIVNNIITGNHGGIVKDLWAAAPDVSNNDVWNNAFNYLNVSPGPSDISENPLFAGPNKNDYHLKSQAGRWDANEGRWTRDEVTSPCIDAGNPMSPIGLEPFPNGGRINMGVYGGTVEASKSYFGEQVCETIVAGDINGDCKVNFLDFRLMALHWLEDNNP